MSALIGRHFVTWLGRQSGIVYLISTGSCVETKDQGKQGDLADRSASSVLHGIKQCCGSGLFFSIRIRGSGFKNPDPDPGDPKRPDST